MTLYERRCFFHPDGHLGRHLELLELLNGDKMSPGGFLK